jgi:hypothetical protein
VVGWRLKYKEVPLLGSFVSVTLTEIGTPVAFHRGPSMTVDTVVPVISALQAVDLIQREITSLPEPIQQDLRSGEPKLYVADKALLTRDFALASTPILVWAWPVNPDTDLPSAAQRIVVQNAYSPLVICMDALSGELISVARPVEN